MQTASAASRTVGLMTAPREANESRERSTNHMAHPSAPTFRSLRGAALAAAVNAAEVGGDGWESNPPRTPQQRPSNGFEDRGRHQPPYIPSPATLTTRAT